MTIQDTPPPDAIAESSYPFDTNDTFDEDFRLVLQHMQEGDSPALAVGALERVILSQDIALQKVAKKFDGTCRVSQEDFKQTGVEAIYDALSRANEDLPPVAFRAYVKFRMLDYMFRLNAEVGGALTVPESALKRVIEVRRILKSLDDGEESFTELLLGQDMKEEIFKYYLIVSNMLYPLSLEILDEEQEATIVPTPQAINVNPADLHQASTNDKLIYEAIAGLTLQQQFVINRYYGLNGHQPAKLAAIGEEMGVTESRICQIHVKAKERLENRLRLLDFEL